MDKFNQSIEKTKKCIESLVLTEADGTPAVSNPLDLFGLMAAYWDKKGKGNDWVGFKKAEKYNASSVFYLVGGSDSLDALGIGYNAKDRELAFKNETSYLQKKIMYVKDKYAKVIVNLNTAYHNNHAVNISKYELYKDMLDKLLDKLEMSLSNKSEPFDVDGKIKGTTSITDLKIFNDGYTTLPLLIYKTFAGVIHQQNQNYAKISDFVDMEIRSRAKYSIKTKLGDPIINMKTAQMSMMDYIKRQEQMNPKLPKIIYITRAKALEYDRQEEKGSFGSRLLKKAVGAVGNDFKTYTKGPNMTL